MFEHEGPLGTFRRAILWASNTLFFLRQGFTVVYRICPESRSVDQAGL